MKIVICIFCIILDISIAQLLAKGVRSVRAPFFALIRHDLAFSPYSVANHNYCRNNSDKYLANFLEWAKNPLTFASVLVSYIWDLLVFSYLF